MANHETGVAIAGFFENIFLWYVSYITPEMLHFQLNIGVRVIACIFHMDGGEGKISSVV